jgi:RNA polymerase sigma-70 factor (ECF subfamily)
MHLQLTDRDLIEGCLKGSRKAQNELYRLYSARLFAVCLRFTGNRKDAEDALQEGFVRIFRNIESFNHVLYPALFPWMRRIMVNNMLNFMRDSRKFKNMEEFNAKSDVVEEVAEDEFFEQLFSEVSPDEILNIISDLPIGYRTVFNLFAFEGYGHQEIANTLDISVNTSKTQLMKARKAIIGKIYEKVNSGSVINNLKR